MAYGSRGPTKKAQARANVLGALKLAYSELDLLARTGRGSMTTKIILGTVISALDDALEAKL